VQEVMEHNNIAFMGFPTKAYSWCKDKEFTKDTKVINIAFINGKMLKPFRYDENISHGEDVDFCIQLIRSGVSIYTYNNFTYINAKGGSQQGGCQGMRTVESMLKDVDYMNLKWGKGTIKSMVVDGIVSHRVRWSQKGKNG